MDQIKTGRFIGEQRKQKSYTQKQLAEILDISDKTVSKWECGNGFPEISLLLPLCDTLDISVNELLSGEKVADRDYRKKAEENMVNMMREKEENKTKMILTAITGVIATISFITLLLVVVTYTEVMSLPVKVTLVLIACVIFAAGLYVAMQGECKIGYYKCRHCEEAFIPTFGAYSMGMHMLTTRWLRCPHCGKAGWCKKVLTKE